MTFDLFGQDWQNIEIAPGAMLLSGFALNKEKALLKGLKTVIEKAPFRHMITPGGFRMSVAMTNCGKVGWVTDLSKYRYTEINPETGLKWPSFPEGFLELAKEAALKAGYEEFNPDGCLINCYEPGAKLSLHQDKNERDLNAPIVSVSLGLPATFLFGGINKNDPIKRFSLVHGDVVVWGGPSRLYYHGINPLKQGVHPLLGAKRINLTFRKVF